ncbi:Major facilitator superfamily domain general substrate transporter protein [Rutstroemia sp. NJR-2017a BBW]|nr:Major facilitator superfamily domain general substrate transporter protein [Rutstroemia sp. NJR-2017a BBW]
MAEQKPDGLIARDSRGDDNLSSSALQMSTINEKALVRKIDRRLLPILSIIYVAAFLDRVNISNALTMSLPKDLKLVGNQRNIALCIFFVPYILFEIPSNIFMKRFKPHVWLSGCILGFGIVMLAQGFGMRIFLVELSDYFLIQILVKSYSGLLATRFFLGFCETGIFPGSFYLISIWYKREESLQRFTVYWCSVIVAGAFGGLLASAIQKMDGLRGLHNWQWIFILEGVLTILIGFSAFFLVTDFPEDAKWLTEEERKFVIDRVGGIEKDQTITGTDVLNFFKSLKNILGGVSVPVYSFAYFTPTIIRTYGYSVVQTQLRTVPPFAAGLGLCLIAAYVSDRLQLRWPFVTFGLILAIIGLAILMTIHHSFSAEYAGICLVAMGLFTAGITILCWFVMNLQGHVERAIGTAWMVGSGGCGGIIATFSFLATDAPFYHTGYSICIGAICIAAACSILYGVLAVYHNRTLRESDGEKKARLYSL